MQEWRSLARIAKNAVVIVKLFFTITKYTITYKIILTTCLWIFNFIISRSASSS